MQKTPMKVGSKMNEYELVNHLRVDEIEDWTKVPEEHFKKTSQIVAILEKSASRRIVGQIKPMPNNVNFFIFAPTDSRIPRLLIPSKKAPTGFYGFLINIITINFHEKLQKDRRIMKTTFIWFAINFN